MVSTGAVAFVAMLAIVLPLAYVLFLQNNDLRTYTFLAQWWRSNDVPEHSMFD